MITRDLKPAFGAATLEAHTAGPSMPLRRSLGLRLGASLLALALSGCGMSQLERHTTAAGILHAGTGLAATIVDEGAREAASRAGDADELQAALRPWRRAEAVQHLAAAAVDVYVAEVLRAAVEAAGDEPDLSRALAALTEALSLYRALADLLSTYGVELPGVGRVLAVVGGAL